MTAHNAVEADVNEPVRRLATIDDICAAAGRIGNYVRSTPTDVGHALSKIGDREIVLKHEYMQRTGSYKVRGAFNRILQLPEGSEVVAASAGNHAQGVALAASTTGRRAIIYMPASAPVPKVDATRNYGADVQLIDGGVDECLAAAVRHSHERNAVFVPPFDDLEVIAGQGTVGLELAEQLPAGTKSVVVPIGGGGLISGVAVALKALRPEIKIIGVEPVGAAAMRDSLHMRDLVTLDKVNTMADGIAVRRVCDLTLAHVEKYVDEIVTVTEEAIGAAVLVLLERVKAVVEPAGAVGIAAIMSGQVANDGTIGAILSGGNIDPVLLSKVIDYGLTTSGRYLRLRVILDDRAGLLAVLSTTLSEMSVNVVLIEHHRAGARGLGFNDVEVQLTLETRNPEQHDEIVNELVRRGFDQVSLMA